MLVSPLPEIPTRWKKSRLLTLWSGFGAIMTRRGCSAELTAIWFAVLGLIESRQRHSLTLQPPMARRGFALARFGARPSILRTRFGAAPQG